MKHTRYILSTISLILLALTTSLNTVSAQSSKQRVRISQSKNTLQSIIKEVDQLLEANKYLYQIQKDNISLDQVDDIFTAQFLPDTLSAIYRKYFEYKTNQLNKDFGLNIHAYYNRNFEPGFSEDEDLYTIQRLYLGLDWNVLDGGFIDNKRKARDLAYEFEINKLEHQNEAKRNNFIYLYNYIMYLFNREKISALNSRYNLLVGKEEIYIQLHYLREKSWEEVIKVKSSLAEVESRIQSLTDYNWHMEKEVDIYANIETFAENLPFIDIDIALVIRHYEKSYNDSIITQLQLDQIENKYRTNFEGWTLRPFLRYNLSQGSNNVNRTYGSVGASARIPLRWGEPFRFSQERRNIVDIEQELLLEENKPTEQRKLDVFNFFYTHQYKKYQIVKFKHTLHLINERIRKQKALAAIQSGNYSPLVLMDQVDEKLAVLFELIDLKKDLYLNALKIYSILDNTEPHEILVEMDLNNLVKKYQGKRAAFLSQSTFKNNSVEKLISFFDLNEIEEIYISTQQTQESEKLKKLALAMHGRHGKLYGIVESETWLKSSTTEQIQNVLSLLEESYDGLLLKFKEKSQENQSNLTEIITLFIRSCIENSMKSGIIIDNIEPIEEITLRTLDIVCISDPNKGSDRFETIDKNKIRLNTLPSKFANRMEMESRLETIMRSTGIHQIAVNNLQQLIQLDMQLQYSLDR